MMKASKLLSIILAIALVFTLCAGVMAAEKGTITIGNAADGQTYIAYKIFDVTYSADKKAYTYTIASTSAWYSVVKGYDGLSLRSVDNYYIVEKENNFDAAKFADLLKDNLSGKTGTPFDLEGNVWKASDLDLGYYLVDTTLGTLCSLDTTNPDVTIDEKNAAPSVTKKVQEDSNDNWGTTNDADINQTVNFKATITVQKGAVNYILHDTMSAGLTYGGVTAVKIGNADVPPDKYTVKTDGTCGRQCTFDVVFHNDYIAGLAPDTQIDVEYSATLNENAVVGMEGNTNKVVLSYGDTPTYSNEVFTTTYTWDMKVFKYTGESKTPLAGAEFVLSRGNEYAVVANGKVTSWVSSQNDATKLTTDSNGNIFVSVLDRDNYALTETKAPDGYNKLNASKEFEIIGAVRGEGNELSYTTVVVEVENNTGTELPSTGGMGTTLFYVLGAILVLGAAVILVVRRRMRAE